MMFDRKENELPPFLYNIGDKIMGFHISIGGEMLVGGEIIGREQSRSYLNDNEYTVKLEPGLCEGCETGKEDITWHIGEKEARPFKQDIWDRAVRHWIESNKLKKKSYLEYIRMYRALRGEPDDISDSMLEKELDERHKIKG